MKIMAENYPGTHVFSQVEEFYRGSGGTKRSFRLSFIRVSKVVLTARGRGVRIFKQLLSALLEKVF